MPDTRNTFYAGYAVATCIYLAYTLSLWVRARRAKLRAAELQQRGRR